MLKNSEREILRALAEDVLHIPYWHMIGSNVAYTTTAMKPGETPDKHTFDKTKDKIVRTDKFLGENGKTSKAISNIVEIGQQPVLSFGNSSGDVGMLEYTLQNNRYPSMAFFVLCDDTERELGNLEKASKLKATVKHQFGPDNSEIIIRSGGTLYPYNDEQWLTLYPIVMDGGRIYTWWAGTANGVVIGSMRLLADSSLDVNSGGRMRIWSGHIVTLNGHTLSLIGAGEKCLSQGGAKLTFTEGVVSLQDGTMVVAGPIHATNTTFDISGNLNMGNTLNASNYVARYTGSSNSGTGALNVYGTFKPVGAGFYGPTMQNGSTVDLSEWKTGVSAASRFPLKSSYASKDTMSFAAGATVTVDLSGVSRADLMGIVDSEKYLTEWTAKPDATFLLDDETKARKFLLKAEGGGLRLSYVGGLVILVR